MTQAKKIYDMLTSHASPTVDQAFLLALNRAEEPYRTVIFEGILDRARSSATAALIAQFHQFSEEYQRILIERCDSLDGGLHLAATNDDPQVRCNVLELLERAGHLHLADVVAALLRDRSPRVARRAGTTLLRLCQAQRRHDAAAATTERQAAGRRALVNALDAALRNYDDHQRSEALLAAMTLIPAAQGVFWQAHIPHSHTVTHAVRRLLMQTNRTQLAEFVVSALLVNDLRGAAARGIAIHTHAEYIAAIAQSFLAQNSQPLRQALRLVRHPQWLDLETLSPVTLPADQQLALVHLTGALGAEPAKLAAYLSAVLTQGCQRAALQAVQSLIALPDDIINEYLPAALKSPQEAVALTALIELIQRQGEDLHRILIQQFASPHGAVRELAALHCRGLAFAAYWRNFDNLSEENKRSAGTAVFKIDPGANDAWLRKFDDPSPDQRLRAVTIARLLDRVDQAAAKLHVLANDANRLVRSAAVAALGRPSERDADADTGCLLHALQDPDSRVRANAVEAIEHRHVTQAADELQPLTQDSNGRVRANAVKALLNWRVENAADALREMVRDRRHQHRRSAAWLLKQLHDAHQDQTPPNGDASDDASSQPEKQYAAAL